jgi:hypothetical protein
MSTSRPGRETLWQRLLALLQELRTPAGRRRARARMRSAVRARMPRIEVRRRAAARRTAPRGGGQPWEERPLTWRPHDIGERLARRARRMGGAVRRGSSAGGRAVLQRYGGRFYSAIGALGGSTVLQERGAEYLADIGARGGAATRQRYGREHYAEIGRKGGLAGRGRKRPRKRPAGQMELGL